MPECPHLERTTAYYDGGLAPEAEADAVAHLADCTECQTVLGDAVGIDAVLAQPRSAVITARRRRWPIAAGVLALAAAVAVFVATRNPKPAHPTQVAYQLELPRERALEARFTGDRFAPHRALGVLRGDKAREAISIASIAELENRGDTRDLVAALAASGDLARAEELAHKLPASASTEADRAAVALAAGDPERALAHAYHALDLDPELAAARWNLGLAARALGLVRVAHAAFEKLATRGEPGWSDEARRQAAVLAGELATARELAEFDRRGAAMAIGGAPLAATDVARAPAVVRSKLYDAVRLATTRARLDELRPLARALDDAAGTRGATAMIDRANPVAHAKFAAAYHTLVAWTATSEQTTALLAGLRAAGRPAHDLLAGALNLSGQATARWQELRTITAPWKDPWFTLQVERERIRATWPDEDLRREPALTAALAACLPAWSLRCGTFALDLATLHGATGREDLADQHAKRALEQFRGAGSLAYVDTARAFLAELHRRRGRNALARAELDEVIASTAGDGDCRIRRYAQIGHATLAVVDGDWALARAMLPPATPPASCQAVPDPQGLAVAVDLARASGHETDRAIARDWIDASKDLARGGLAIVATARIAPADAAAQTTMEGWLANTRGELDSMVAAARTWGLTTQIADAGARADWTRVLALATAPAAGCVVVASVDDDWVTVAVRGMTGVAGSHRAIARAQLATTPIVTPELVTALAGCPEVIVVARPPLHGRADLLPAELPWVFAGDTPAVPQPAGTPRAIEVVDARPPDSNLPPLPPGVTGAKFELSISAQAATPRRVLAALAEATYAELHVHGIATSNTGDTAYLALSPDPDGAFALRADTVRATRLARAPLVVLAACRAAAVAPYLRTRWSLPDAFIAAGASAVIAVDVPIPDASA
ncbi:MAG: hypothetical protein WKG01_41800, partial [Kofleriaceae bacterium]